MSYKKNKKKQKKKKRKKKQQQHEKKEREKRKTIKEQLLKDATFTIDKRKRGLHNPTGIIEKKRSERMISCTLNPKTFVQIS